MTTAREFFERARAASDDAERCRSQLKMLEGKMHSIGSQGFEPRVRTSASPDAMERRVGAYVDREAALERRVAEDYDVIDRACLVLYGSDEVVGLDRARSAVWADVLWWRYLDGATWPRVAKAVGYSPRPCQLMRNQAFEWMDAARFMADVMGV